MSFRSAIFSQSTWQMNQALTSDEKLLRVNSQQSLIYDVCYGCPLIVLCFVATLTYKSFVVWWQISFATSSRTNLDQNDNFEKFCHYCTVTRKCCKNVYCFASKTIFFFAGMKDFQQFLLELRALKMKIDGRYVSQYILVCWG